MLLFLVLLLLHIITTTYIYSSLICLSSDFLQFHQGYTQLEVISMDPL